ncbi:MAG: ORF6N domain-containing protein [Bacteroidetes bacterium]|nr:ORF6N domain-containing protein [Bacteroidota bacterium]
MNEAVKRNRNRFPEDFLFRLTRDEHDALTSQIAISNKGRIVARSASDGRKNRGAVAVTPCTLLHALCPFKRLILQLGAGIFVRDGIE